jgi:N-acetylglutamate synthase-like GNAT family acetyltransferase
VIEITEAGPADHADIAALYAEAGYGAAIESADTLLVAWAGAQLAGVVRLCAEEGVTVLRGMQVLPAFQRRGVGSKLLAACGPRLDGQLAFCLPYVHLKDFYAAAGFTPASADILPDFLARRLADYRAKGQQVLAMRRDPACVVVGADL